METLTIAPAEPARGKMAVDPEKYVRKIVTLERELWQEVDDLRFELRLRTDNAALKMLIEAGLKLVRAEKAAAAATKPRGRRR